MRWWCAALAMPCCAVDLLDARGTNEAISIFHRPLTVRGTLTGWQATTIEQGMQGCSPYAKDADFTWAASLRNEGRGGEERGGEGAWASFALLQQLRVVQNQDSLCVGLPSS